MRKTLTPLERWTGCSTRSSWSVPAAKRGRRSGRWRTPPWPTSCTTSRTASTLTRSRGSFRFVPGVTVVVGVDAVGGGGGVGVAVVVAAVGGVGFGVGVVLGAVFFLSNSVVV